MQCLCSYKGRFAYIRPSICLGGNHFVGLGLCYVVLILSRGFQKCFAFYFDSIVNKAFMRTNGLYCTR